MAVHSVKYTHNITGDNITIIMDNNGDLNKTKRLILQICT